MRVRSTLLPAVLAPLAALAACHRDDVGFGVVNREGVGRIAFVATRSSGSYLALMNADGSGYRVIERVRNAGDPRWDPSGRRILVRAAVDSVPGLWIFDPATGDATRLPPLSTRSSPSWSPDGGRLLLARYDSTGSARVAIANADGTGLADQFVGDAPDWGPADRIAYLAPTAEWNGGWPALFVRTLGDAAGTRVTPIDSAQLDGAAWCGDGSLAYVRTRFVPDSVSWNVSLRIIRPGQAGARVLHADHRPMTIEQPAWSRDCRHLVATLRSPRGNAELWVLRADGTGRWRITPHVNSATRAYGNADASWAQP